MKKFSSKQKVFSICFKLLLAILLVLLVLVVPTAIISLKAPLEEYFSPKSAFQGVIEIWNIDTFEGGEGSKSSYLQSLALDYQNSSKGTYFLVKNMSEEECLLALEQGQCPSLFSFGSSFGKKIQDKLEKLSDKFNVSNEIVNSAKSGDEIFAVGYARSSYVLISSKNNLVDSEALVSSQAFVCGNKKLTKKWKEKITYSLVFGSKTCHPHTDFVESFYPLVAGETTFDKTSFDKTSYQAYCDFVDGKSKILLGTVRDFFRVQNRANLGKFSEPIYEPVGSGSDLVQYFGISFSASAQEKEICKNFIQFVLSENSQQKLKKIGLFSVRNMKLYDDTMGQIENKLFGSKVDNIFE